MTSSQHISKRVIDYFVSLGAEQHGHAGFNELLFGNSAEGTIRRCGVGLSVERVLANDNQYSLAYRLSIFSFISKNSGPSLGHPFEPISPRMGFFVLHTVQQAIYGSTCMP